jgi:2,3-bisphosphoglycerate-dependent phosphoglycerate mutase
MQRIVVADDKQKITVQHKYGYEQVQSWRRHYNVLPPALAETDSRHPSCDQRYFHLQKEELPCAESLEDTLNRILPYWNRTIVPKLMEGKGVLISAHGSSIRALVKHLDNISDENFVGVNIPTGTPLVYELVMV